MTGRQLHLGLDVGTQGTKGLLIDAEEQRVVARAHESYGLIAGLPPGAAEQDPESWIGAVRAVAARLLADPAVDAVDARDVRGVGVSGQQHGLVALGEDGRAVRPAKLWCDTEAGEEAAELSRAFGRAVPAGYTAPKILWMKRREPELFGRMRCVLLPHDYVNFRLTGRLTAEAGDASGTGLFDPIERRYDVAAAAWIDERLPAMLPPLVAAGEPAGELSDEGAALLGLAPGIPVASGGGDNMLSAIGSGASEPGVLVLSLGTSGTAFCTSARPIVDPEGLVAPFCDSAGGWLPLVCVMNMTGVLEELRLCFGPGFGPGADHDTLAREAAAVPAGCEGLYFLPYFAGERVPDLPRASGLLCNIRPGLLRRGHLYRAALEATSLSLALGVERLARCGIQPRELRVAGGGSQSALWLQILADVLEAPLRRLAEPESAALGAALQSLWTLRRLAGERIRAGEVARPFVRFSGEPTFPDRALAALYRDARARLAETTALHFGP